MPITLYIALTIIITTPAYWAKRKASGKYCTPARRWALSTYSFILISIHTITGAPDSDFFDEQTEENLRVFAPIALLAFQVMALPTRCRLRPWWRRRTIVLKIRKHKPTFDEYRQAHGKQSPLIFWQR